MKHEELRKKYDVAFIHTFYQCLYFEQYLRVQGVKHLSHRMQTRLTGHSASHKYGEMGTFLLWLLYQTLVEPHVWNVFEVEINGDPKHLIQCIIFNIGCVREATSLRSKFPNFHAVWGQIDELKLVDWRESRIFHYIKLKFVHTTIFNSV